MTWLDGDAPILLAGGGGPAVSYRYATPCVSPEHAPTGFAARPCAWCSTLFSPQGKRHARYCSKSCGMHGSHARGDRTPAGGTVKARALAAGLRPNTVYGRVHRRMTLDAALRTPVGKARGRRAGART